MSWWQWVLIVLALGILGVIGMEIPDLLRYLRIKRMYEGGATMCLAIPGKLVELPAERPQFAIVEVAGVRRQVNIDLLSDEPLESGDWVLIHVGFAMSKISEAGAAEQMRLLAMLGEDAAAMEEIEGYDFGQTAGEVGVMKYVDEYPRSAPHPAGGRRDPPPGEPRPPLPDHGGLRRPHPRHLPLRPRPTSCPRTSS